MVILGIDPGSGTTGYGVIKIHKSKSGSQKPISCVNYGCITTDASLSPENRLKQLYRSILALMSKYKPSVVAVEKVYFFKNLKTAMPVSQAKGVILLAAAQKKIPVREFTPLEIKSAVVGYGNAEKSQVQKMVKVLLKLKDIPKPDDAADALGAALCCVYSNIELKRGG